MAGCRTGWSELRNKLEAFYLFTHSDSILQLASGARPVPLAQLVARARALEAFQSFWIIEGLGYHYARVDAAGTRQGRPFASEAGTRLSCNPIPLQAGAWLWLAESSLAANQDAETLIRSYLQWNEEGPMDGFSSIAYEALGFVVRNLCPSLIGPLDRRLAESSKELQAYFWHGIGRGIYFALTDFLPYRRRTLQGFAECRELPPHELGRINAVSGFAWALALINLRHPEIVERFLYHSAPQLPEHDAFSNGVLSALTVWLKSVPGDRFTHDFCQHQPTSFAVRRLWDATITTPAHQLQRLRAEVESREVERLFRYQPLQEFLPASPS